MYLHCFYSEMLNCNMMMFCDIFQVLDKAERLREMDANILPAFLRLQELVKSLKYNVCKD